MRNTTGMIFFIIFSLSFAFYAESAPKGKKTGVTFDKALPEDISNENFPDRIDSFDFPNANLLDLVKAIGKLTGINFIVDPSLSSKQISIIAPSPITVAEAYKAFLSALSVNGFTLVKSGAFWKIQSTDKAHRDNIEVYSGDYFPNTDQLITRIIKLKHINAKDFEASIKLFLSENHKISTLESSNSIILSDYGAVIERIMKFVYELDVPGSGENIQLIQIEHASAEELAIILGDLLSIGAKSPRSSFLSKSRRNRSRVTLSPSVRKEGGVLAGKIQISKIIPDQRTNSLVVSANKKGFERVQELVKKLDAPIDPSRTGGVYVYNVLYGTAEEVYNTLMGIKPSGQADNRSRSNPFSGPIRSRRVGSSFSSSSAQSPLFGDVNIMADTNTNSLIISAKNKYEYERVLSVLKKIDVPRDQVFIQAIIVEMILDSGDEKDFNLAGAVGGLLKSGIKNLTTKKIQVGDRAFPVPDGLNSVGEILDSAVGGFLGQAIGLESLQKASMGPGLILGLPFMKFLEKLNVGTEPTRESISARFPEYDNFSEERKAEILNSAIRNDSNNLVNQSLSRSFIPLLRLLKTSSNVNVLSTPQLTTLDNVEAFIEVGENAPVGLTSTATAGAFSQNSVERQDITLKLNIIPRINPKSGTVQMDIKQKFDDFSNRSSSASELASRGVHIIKRNIETKMVLHDGETAVLGGLLTDKEIKSENKVPFLGDVPLLGWLFKGGVVKKEKRNLLVFITPTIIRGKNQKDKAKELLEKKLEERIEFIEKHMKGKDPHGKTLDKLISGSKEVSKKVLEMEEVSAEEQDQEKESFIKTISDKLFPTKRPKNKAKEQIDLEEKTDIVTETVETIKEEELKEEIKGEELKEETAGFAVEDIEAIEEDLQEEIEGEEPQEDTSPYDYQEAIPLEDSSFEESSEEFDLSTDDFIPIEPEILE